jgi:hypothetical protein
MKITIDTDQLAEVIADTRDHSFKNGENNEKHCFDLAVMTVATKLFFRDDNQRAFLEKSHYRAEAIKVKPLNMRDQHGNTAEDGRKLARQGIVSTDL